MEYSECDLILQACGILVKPRQSEPDTRSDNSLMVLLQHNLDQFEQFIQENKILRGIWTVSNLTSCIQDTSLVWKFASSCLKLLHILQECLKTSVAKYNSASSHKENLSPNQAPSLPPDTLSFDQQKNVLAAFQFIVCFGVFPNLQVGVGIPLDKRTGFSSVLSKLLNETRGENASLIESELKLLVCAKVFISCLDVQSISVLLLTRHLNDILAVLLQLNFGKKQLKNIETKETQNETTVNGNDNTAASKNINEIRVTGDMNKETQSSSDTVMNTLSIKSNDFCEAALNRLTNNIKSSLLVRELIVLQGGPRTKKPGFLPPAPTWLRQVCGQLLSDILVKPDGVLHIIHGVVGIDGNLPVSQTSFFDWRKCDAAAKIIAHSPKKTISVDEYFKLISPQILNLLHLSDDGKAKMYLRVCCSIIKEMNIQNELLTDQYILQPVILPLLMCRRSPDKLKKHQDVIVSEEDLERCVTDLHKIFVCGLEPGSEVTKSLKHVVGMLFSLMCFCSKGCANLRQYCEELLVTYFKHVDKSEALNGLIRLVCDCDMDSITDVSCLNTNIMFIAGQSGGVQVVVTHDAQSTEGYDDDRIHCLQNILKHLQSNGLAGDFLLFLLKKLTDMIREQTERETSSNNTNGRNTEILLDIERNQTKEMNLFNKRLIILNLLAVLSDSLDPSCMKTNEQTLEFVKATLERGVEVCKHTEDEIFGLFENETMTMAMGILTAIMADSSNKIREEDKCKMEELLPLLEELSMNHPEAEIQEMATDLRIAIRTRGIVVSEMMKTKTADKMKPEKPTSLTRDQNKKPLIEVLPDTSHPVTSTELHNRDIVTSNSVKFSLEERQTNSLVSKQLDSELKRLNIQGPTVSESSTECNEIKQSELQKVFEELCHPEIPIRGHALLTLIRLIQCRDKATMEHHDSVLNILEENLAHADTYLYLPSVSGLVAMADIFPDKVIPRLTKEFSTIIGNKTNLQSEHKMKVGEALVKTSRMLGDMMPKYKKILLPAVLCGIKDGDPLVRASSLSNLSEICHLLHFSLGTHIHEIIMCCGSVLRSDKEDEVRKAAALVLTHLLQGVGKDVFQILDSALRDLYRILKSVYSTETNKTVKDQLILALNELDDIMRDVLFPKQVLAKKIRVLSVD